MDKELLTKFVVGECTAEEEARVEAELRRDPAFKVRLERLRQVWEASRSAPGKWDASSGWETFRARIQDDQRKYSGVREPRRPDRPGTPVRRPANGGPRARRKTIRGLTQAAGVAVVLFIASAVAAYLAAEDGLLASGGDKVFTTQEGQRATVTLLDGTRIRLNVDTKLTVDRTFGTERRTVHLDGEAYFEVEPDSIRPFVVQTNEARVEVRGTKFNVLSYADQEETAVAVTEGEVALQPQSSPRSDSVALLQQHSIGIVSSTDFEGLRRNADLSSHVAWLRGTLVFDDASFSEVERKLERWYGIQVSLDAPREEIIALNASFDGELIDEVLQTISVALELKHNVEREEVTFYR